jgi:hypothetical protein
MGKRRRNSDSYDYPSLAEIEWDEGAPAVAAADALFATTRRRLLGLLFGQPDRSFHIRELAEASGSGYGATHRELQRLLQAGLIRVDVGRLHMLRACPDCVIYAELVGLVRNSFGLADPLRDAFNLVADRIQVAFVFEGMDIEPGLRRPIELLVVSAAAAADWAGIDYAAHVAQPRLRRCLRLLIATPEELREPRWFLGQVLAQPRVWVFGDEGRLAAMTSGP